MTTWCRPPQRRDSTSSTQRSRRSGSSSIVANKRPLEETIASTGHHKSSRHSIADILGWTQSASVKIEQVDNDGDLEEEEEEESTDMASDYVDMADMVMSDEPLDLSLDKSKCRRVERERSELNSSPAIKRAKVVVDTMDRPASDGGTDEADLDASGPWGNVQPHLQMAANFSTVLQYYLTAARLWQTSEVIRCQESQQRTAETDSEPNEMGDDGHQSDTAAAVVAAVAAAAAAADSAVAPIQSNNTKRRKKDHNNLAVADLGAGAGSDGSRPRKTRTTFTGKQLFELERIFEQKKYLSSNERQEVARLLNVTGSQVSLSPP